MQDADLERRWPWSGACGRSQRILSRFSVFHSFLLSFSIFVSFCLLCPFAPNATKAYQLPRKIHIYFSDTGGGHRASALALEASSEARHVWHDLTCWQSRHMSPLRVIHMLTQLTRLMQGRSGETVWQPGHKHTVYRSPPKDVGPLLGKQYLHLVVTVVLMPHQISWMVCVSVVSRNDSRRRNHSFHSRSCKLLLYIRTPIAQRSLKLVSQWRLILGVTSLNMS